MDNENRYVNLHVSDNQTIAHQHDNQEIYDRRGFLNLKLRYPKFIKKYMIGICACRQQIRPLISCIEYKEYICRIRISNQYLRLLREEEKKLK